MTPALAVDDAVKTIGRVLTKGDIIALLQGKNKTDCSTCPSSGPFFGSLLLRRLMEITGY